MKSRPALIVPAAGLLAIAAIAIPIARHAGADDRPAPRDVTTETTGTTETNEGEDAVLFRRFPLDLGWAEAYGKSFIEGPGPGAGGISMPEGHCDDEVLFA